MLLARISLTLSPPACMIYIFRQVFQATSGDPYWAVVDKF